MDSQKVKIQITNSIKSFEEFLIYHKNDKQNTTLFIQEAPTYICDIIKKFIEYCDKTNATKHQKFVVLSYLLQHFAMYEFLKKTYCNHTKDKEATFEVAQCVIRQLLNTCNNYESALDDSCDNTVGSFIKLMDTALDTISEIDVKKGASHLQTSSVIVDEILCFSMSVAQVSCTKDRKVITASCQIVLHNMKSLQQEMTKTEVDLAMRKLLVEVYTNSLCALEAKVNLVVLNLCLKTFSDYRSHVCKLYDACLEITNKTALNFVTSNFDLYMDRLFQIGLFSLACSSTNKRSVEIKVLLSTLQFLELELVPAFMAMSNSTLCHRKTYADIFKRYWCLQVKKLRFAVHNIIEPDAYCKLVVEELNFNLERIWDCVLKGETVQKETVEPFIIYTKELGKMIKSCLRSDVNKELQVVCNVVQELEVAVNVFLDDTFNTTTAKNVNKKIFKRCKVLVKTITNLRRCINKGEGDESSGSFSDDSKSCTNQDVHLKSIIARSQQLVKDRSMCVTFNLGPKINLTTNLNRTFQSRRHLKFRDGCIVDKDLLEDAFGDLQKSFQTITSIDEEDL